MLDGLSDTSFNGKTPEEIVKMEVTMRLRGLRWKRKNT